MFNYSVFLWGEDGFSFWISEEGVFIDALIVIAAIILFDTCMPKNHTNIVQLLGMKMDDNVRLDMVVCKCISRGLAHILHSSKITHPTVCGELCTKIATS